MTRRSSAFTDAERVAIGEPRWTCPDDVGVVRKGDFRVGA